MERSRDIYQRILENGKKAIEDFIADRKAEELFLDFKRSANDGATIKLAENDRKNLAKAISGFGNSEGGVIVWGVDCSLDHDGADVAKALIPIENPKRFASLLQGAVSGCTVPPHSGVENHVIETEKGKGVVVTLIPKSNSAPHQMLPNKQYYIRAGSDFVPPPHDVLSGMFGRRPQPHVFHQFVFAQPDLEKDYLKISLGIQVYNEGPGIATDTFINCLMHDLPGSNCHMHFETPDEKNWSGNFAFGRKISIISNQGLRIPPTASSMPLILSFMFKPPFNGILKISGNVGSGESRRYEFIIENSADNIQEQYYLFLQKTKIKAFSEEDRSDISRTLLGFMES
jgi:hypothetical protein